MDFPEYLDLTEFTAAHRDQPDSQASPAQAALNRLDNKFVPCSDSFRKVGRLDTTILGIPRGRGLRDGRRG